MKCRDCKHYDAERSICTLAQEGSISKVDDPICLLRLQISLLRSINDNMLELIELHDYDNDDDGPEIGSSDWWKRIE